jgi:hypothetical protein
MALRCKPAAHPAQTRRRARTWHCLRQSNRQILKHLDIVTFDVREADDNLEAAIVLKDQTGFPSSDRDSHHVLQSDDQDR